MRPRVAHAPPARRRAGGFSLIEALVAITILAGTSMAVYAAVNTWLVNYERLEAAERRAEASRSLVGLVSSLNPMAEPEGERTFGNLTLRWRAVLVEPERPGAFSAGFRFGLYDVTAVALASGETVAEVRMRAIGHRSLAVQNLF